MKDYRKILMGRYSGRHLDRSDRLLLDFMCDIPAEHGFENEMLEWLQENPDADLQAVAAYEDSFLTPLEIVDDDELDEGED